MLQQDYESPLPKYAGRIFTPEELEIEIADEVIIAGQPVPSSNLPRGFAIHPETGIVGPAHLQPRRLHAWPRPYDFAHCTRACRTPGGDILAMCVVGRDHQFGKTGKLNEMVAYRSSDNGKTWSDPVRPWDVPYSQHAFNTLIPHGSRSIVAFGTDFHPDFLHLPHSGALGIRHSEDDGHTWSEVRRATPFNDPGMRGVYHMQGCESMRGTWLLGTYTVEHGPNGRIDHQYVMRSEDAGNTWELLPGPRPAGWRWAPNQRMMEGRILRGREDMLLMFTRTCEGHLWRLSSEDDGRTWSEPVATELVHPDAPPMIFNEDGDSVLLALTHNRPGGWFEGRDELWVARSEDEGRSWSEPRFLLANAARPMKPGHPSTMVSYADMIIEDGTAHLFLDHGSRQVLQLHMELSGFQSLPTREQLFR